MDEKDFLKLGEGDYFAFAENKTGWIDTEGKVYYNNQGLYAYEFNSVEEFVLCGVLSRKLHISVRPVRHVVSFFIYNIL